MTKRLLAAILAAVLCLTAAACAKQTGGAADTLKRAAQNGLSAQPETDPETGTKPEPEAEPEKEPAKEPEKEPEAEPEKEPEGTLLDLNMFSLTYSDDWTLDEEKLKDSESYGRAVLYVPDGENAAVTVTLTSVKENAKSYRSTLAQNGIDDYEYVENHAYETQTIAELSFVRSIVSVSRGDKLVLLARAESAGVTDRIEVEGAYDDARVEALLSTLAFKSGDEGKSDPPWPWNGERFSAEDASVPAGDFTLEAQFLPFAESVVTREVFEHRIAAVGNDVYVLSEGVLNRYALDGTTLTFVEQVDIPAKKFGDMKADNNGCLWLGGFGCPLICVEDGAVTATYEGAKDVTIAPEGTWGISHFPGSKAQLFTLSGGSMTLTEHDFAELSMITFVEIDDGFIFLAGSRADGSGHGLFVYNYDCELLYDLKDPEDWGLGSMTFACATANGFLAFDGNLREVYLWDAEGAPIASVKDRTLFSTGYPWFCGSDELPDGAILTVMTEDRKDKSATELLVFRLSGF